MNTAEVLIDLTLQRGHPSWPLVDTWVPAESAATFRLKGLAVDTEADVQVMVVNADGVPLTISASQDGGDWIAEFPVSHFTRYGFVENGFRVDIVRDGVSHSAAHGNLMVEKVDASAQPGAPAEHLITKEELAELFAHIEVADVATQKEVRVALQHIIALLKGIAQ